MRKLSNYMKAYRAALYDFDAKTARAELAKITGPDPAFRMCTPFQTYPSAQSFFDATYLALAKAMPDMECRDQIRINGVSHTGQQWVGIMGHVIGTFQASFLDIPPTGHIAHMRYHEFFRFERGKIVEMQAIWDIPEMMIQAGAWPMAPGLGREWHIPPPAALDGIRDGQVDPAQAAHALKVVEDMLEQMKDYPANGGPETMQLERFWHPKMNWYGPAGIGSARGYEGFIDWHMTPWVSGMPNWSTQDFHGLCHFFGDGPYVGETGWPAMQQTLVADGFRGIPPTGQTLDIRGLDFWRLDGDLIRENWVMVDLLHMYAQLGVDVMARMREFTKARKNR